IRITRRQVWYRTIDQRLISGTEKSPRGAVSHREWTTVNIRRRCEEVSQRTLMHARQTSVLLLVRRSNHAMLGGNALSHTPKRRQLDLVNAISPRVPLC